MGFFKGKMFQHVSKRLLSNSVMSQELSSDHMAKVVVSSAVASVCKQVIVMTASFGTVRSMGLGCSHGQMAPHMLASGVLAGSMAWVCTVLPPRVLSTHELQFLCGRMACPVLVTPYHAQPPPPPPPRAAMIVEALPGLSPASLHQTIFTPSTAEAANMVCTAAGWHFWACCGMQRLLDSAYASLGSASAPFKCFERASQM